MKRINFSELAAKSAQLNACEMAGICESETEFYLHDGEVPDATVEEIAKEKEKAHKHLRFLNDLYRQKGGYAAQMSLRFVLPSDAQVEVELISSQEKLFGYVSWERDGMDFPHSSAISTGDRCLLPAEDPVLVVEIARACSVAPRDLTLDEKHYILDHPTFCYSLISRFQWVWSKPVG